MAQTVAITASANGDNTVLAGVAGRRWTILAYHLSFSGTVNAKFRSGPNGGSMTDQTGLFYGAAGVQCPSPASPPGYIKGPQGLITAKDQGDDLVLNLSGATAVGGWVLVEWTN